MVNKHLKRVHRGEAESGPMMLSRVCASSETPLPVDWRLLVEERIANIGIPLDILRVFAILIICCDLKRVLVFGCL